MEEFLDVIARSALGTKRRSADLAAAFASEIIVDNNGNTKPTAFHFTAGQQTFSKMVTELVNGVEEADFKRALVGPWTRSSKLPSLSWDATATRYYALRATDPSKEKRGSEPGAEWLAFRALPFYPVAPRGKRLVTPGVEGGWKNATFSWPLWTRPCTLPAIRSLLSYKGLGVTSQRERSMRGIAAVLSSDIKRSDQGGYGSFSPSRVR